LYFIVTARRAVLVRAGREVPARCAQVLGKRFERRREEEREERTGRAVLGPSSRSVDPSLERAEPEVRG